MPRGDDLVAQIREDIPYVHFVDPQGASNYELFKRIRTFLEGFGVYILRNAETGANIGRRVIVAIYGNNPIDCKKAIDIFRGDKTRRLPSVTRVVS